MYGLRLKDGTRIAGLFYKPKIHDVIRIDETDTWYKVIEIIGRVAYAKQAVDPRW